MPDGRLPMQNNSEWARLIDLDTQLYNGHSVELIKAEVRSQVIEECAKQFVDAAGMFRVKLAQSDPDSKEHQQYVGAIGALMGLVDAIRALSTDDQHRNKEGK